MSGPSRLRRPNTSMQPPSRTQSRLANDIASSPARSSSYQTTRSARHGTVSPTGHRNKRTREVHQEESNEMNINVVVRVRGRNERELKENSAVVVSTPGGLKGKEVALSMGPLALTNKTYSFDRAFGPETDQSQIYDNVVEPILNEVLEGYNCTIFAYGQTGTGKTYTMSGDMEESFGSFADTAGIIPRTLYNLFKALGPDAVDNSVKCSFIELYNEELRDLLANEHSAPVKIFDDSARKGGVIVQGMEETFIKSAADGVKLLQDGSHKRQVAATKCNDLSSRSHTVFTITIHAKYINDDGEDMMRTGKLNLVDLAGSENIGRSGAENKRAREAGMINQSLLTLGRVINALVDKSQHIPYRESKLTRLLQDSLGGRTKTCIIATISPAKTNIEETMSTLDYASRAKNIRNKPQLNQMLSKKTVLIEYATEIERLKADLKAARTKHGIFLTQETFDELSEENESRRILLEEYERKIELLEKQIKKKQEQYETSMKKFMDTKTKLDVVSTELGTTKETLQYTENDLSVTTTALKEETAIRQAHEKTEEELQLAGKTLLSTVGTTVTDINKLHSKVGRMAQLEFANSSRWYQHEERARGATTAIEQNLAHLSAETQQQSHKVVSRVDEFVQISADRLKQTYGQISERLAVFEKAEAELVNSTRDGKEKMDVVLEEIKELRDDIKTRIGEGLEGLGDAAQQMASGVIADLSLFGGDLHNSYNRLRKDVGDTLYLTHKDILGQDKYIDSIENSLAAANVATEEATLKAYTELEEILVSERATADAERAALISQISSLINATAKHQDRRLTSRVDGVRSQLDDAGQKILNATQACRGNIAEYRSSNETTVRSIAESKERILAALEEDQQDVEKRSAAIQLTANAVHAQTLELVSKQTDNIDKQMSALDTYVETAHEHNDLHHAAFTTSLEALTQPTISFLENAHLDIPPQQDELAQLYDNVAQDILENNEYISVKTTDIVETLADFRDKLANGQVQEYVPTGDTPRKRKYETVNGLPQTESHEEILARLNGLPRPPLSDKEVNSSPAKQLDPRSGGSGIGSAFYPVKYAGNAADEDEGTGDDKEGRSMRMRAKRPKVYDDRENLSTPNLPTLSTTPNTNLTTRKRRA